MGFLSSGGGQKANPPAWVFPSYTGLQLMTSAESLPVPLVYGFTKISPNIIYQGNFQAHAQYSYQAPTASSGGIFGIGGSGGQSGYWYISGYTYSVDLCLALCEGPVSNIGQVWSNNNVYLFQSSSPNPEGYALSQWGVSTSKGPASGGITLFGGGPGQTPWSYLTTNFPANALSYQGLSYLGAASYNLGQTAAIGTLNFEIAGLFYGTGANGIDADPALVINDFLTHPTHGVPGFPASALDTTTLFGVSGDSSVQSYCAALSLCFSPALVQQETASSVLTRWAQLLNLGAVWTGGKLRFVPYGDMSIEGATVNWTAPTTPVYALTTDHFAAQGGSAAGADGSPVVASRSDPLSLYNMQRLEVFNRAGVNFAAALVAARTSATLAQMVALATHGAEPGQGIVTPVQGQPQYQATPIEARDLNGAEIIGLRIAPTLTAHEICDLNVASIVAQTLLQRGLYVRNRFSFTVSFVFCLLDPMDIVSLTEPLLGLSSALVRITGIEEQDDGSLKITAEELTIGVSTPGPNPTSGVGSTTINQNVVAEGVDASTIYEPPSAATNGSAALWVAASGGVGGVPDPNFGGANIFVSVDGGSSYTQYGQVSGATPIGTLMANLASAAGWDTTNTLSVNLSESGGALVSTTAGNAQSGAANVVLIGSELIGFETATLTGANAYDLTGLQRGLFGTTPAAHAFGAQFTLMSKAAQISLLAQWVGVLLYFKLQSFNIYGAGAQALSACTAIPYTPSGAGFPGSQVNTVTQTLALSGASVLTTTAQIPAGAYLLGVNVTIGAAVTGPTSINVDPQYLASGAAGGSSGAFGSCGVSLGASDSYSTGGALWSVASGIKLTAVGGAFVSGSATVSITYLVI